MLSKNRNNNFLNENFIGEVVKLWRGIVFRRHSRLKTIIVMKVHFSLCEKFADSLPEKLKTVSPFSILNSQFSTESL